MMPINQLNRDKWSFPGGIIERHGIGKPWTAKIDWLLANDEQAPVELTCDLRVKEDCFELLVTKVEGEGAADFLSAATTENTGYVNAWCEVEPDSSGVSEWFFDIVRAMIRAEHGEEVTCMVFAKVQP